MYTLRRSYRRESAAILDKILSGSTKFNRQMTQILADVKANKEHSQAGMEAGA